jgi:hypothetical protein
MLVATILGVVLVPVLFVAVERLFGKGAKEAAKAPPEREPPGHAQPSRGRA